jgi:hypothetical protein
MRSGVLCIFFVVALAANMFAQTGYETWPSTPVQPMPWSAPQLATPVVSLSAPSRSAAGASNATAENQAGARNSTFATLHEPLNNTALESPYSIWEPNSIWEPMGEEDELQPGVPHLINLGPANFDSAYGASSPREDRGLGEIARLRLRKDANRNVRVYTNEDIDRINATSGLGLVPKSSPAPQR